MSSRLLVIVVVAVVAAGVAGCGAAPPLVPLDESWPTQAGNFDKLTTAWTRHGEFRRDYQQVLTVDATFKSPAWRVAHATRQASQRGLDPTSTAALLAESRAASDKAYEIELVISTWDRRENDLQRGERATWKATLIDDTGRAVAPTRIERDKRPKHVLRAEFPQMGDFAEAYVAYFPHDPPVLGPAVHRVRLRLSSERGSVEVAWEAPTGR